MASRSRDEVKSAEIVEGIAGEPERNRLRLGTHDPVYRIRRVRLRQDRPFMVEEVALPPLCFQASRKITAPRLGSRCWHNVRAAAGQGRGTAHDRRRRTGGSGRPRRRTRRAMAKPTELISAARDLVPVLDACVAETEAGRKLPHARRRAGARGRALQHGRAAGVRRRRDRPAHVRRSAGDGGAGQQRRGLGPRGQLRRVAVRARAAAEGPRARLRQRPARDLRRHRDHRPRRRQGRAGRRRLLRDGTLALRQWLRGRRLVHRQRRGRRTRREARTGRPDALRDLPARRRQRDRHLARHRHARHRQPRLVGHRRLRARRADGAELPGAGTKRAASLEGPVVPHAAGLDDGAALQLRRHRPRAAWHRHADGPRGIEDATPCAGPAQDAGAGAGRAGPRRGRAGIGARLPHRGPA